MKIVRNVVVVLALLLVVLVGTGFLLPSRFAVERTTVIAAPADSIYRRVVTPCTWATWSSWTPRRDSTLVFTCAGPAAGVGAVMRFRAQQVGGGDLEIVEAVPGRTVGYVLRFAGSDLKVHGRVTLENAAGGTRVTWRDSGDLGGNVLLRYFVPVLNRNLAAAYATSFRGLSRETAAPE